MKTFPDHLGRKLAFIDLEASGLSASSWPVEVGWAFEDGPATAMIIKQDASWKDEAWDANAEALHGISRAMLLKEGRDVSAVCQALNEALGECAVYSDAPDWDGFWLYRLFSAARAKQSFKLLAFADLVVPRITGREEALLAQAAAQAPRRHRAAADAVFLQTLFRLASQ